MEQTTATVSRPLDSIRFGQNLSVSEIEALQAKTDAISPLVETWHDHDHDVIVAD